MIYETRTFQSTNRQKSRQNTNTQTSQTYRLHFILFVNCVLFGILDTVLCVFSFMKKSVILDYGVGNLHSLRRAFLFCGIEAVVTEDAEVVGKADAFVLPGVGSFEAGMRGLAVRGLIKAVKTHVASNKPVLGICLGAQLMMERGYEFGKHIGLGIIQGEVVRFPKLAEKEKIPQIGWNNVKKPEWVSWDKTIFDSFCGSPISVYFVHSYILVPKYKENILGLSEYGDITFCS